MRLTEITATETDGIQTINARELHEFLESGQDFSTWIKSRIDKYDFTEGEDYVRFHKKMEANNATMIEYHISLSMAKELSMVENNDKGKEARRYFIKIEEEYKKRPNVDAITRKDLAKMLLESEEERERAVAERRELQTKIAADANKVAFAENVEKTVDNLSIQDYAKILYHEDARIGQNRLFFLLRRKGILDKHNKPYQKYIDNGWFVLKLGTYVNKSTDNVVEYTQPRITGKGQLALRTRIIDWLSGADMAVAE